MVRIAEVGAASLAYRAGIRAGDMLVSVDGHEIRDVLDYRFYICSSALTLGLLRDGKAYTAKIKKDEYDDIGLAFDTFLMDCKRSCQNRCIFCFIDQLPRGMRDTLYFKDDDSRLSFLQGNYITMTNLGDKDVERIIKMRMSPINISVHTTNPELRVAMLHNKKAGAVLSYLEKFAGAGIEMNGQIVLCRGINDGEALTRTMHDLAGYFPQMASVSVVPAGLTRFREGLYPLTPFSPEEAKAVIRQVERFAKGCKEYYGSPIFYCSDELYLEAGLPVPKGDYYGEYRQIENGVGMIASMRDEFEAALKEAEPTDKTPRTVSLATGAAAYPFISEITEKLTAKFPYIKANVYKTENDFFGRSVTVAGLITGRDLLAQLAGKDLGSMLYLPACMLRYDRDKFLCDTTVTELSEALGVPLCFVENDGYEFVDKILNG